MAVTKREPGRTLKPRAKRSGSRTMHLATHGGDVALAPGILSDVLSRKRAATGLLNGFGKAVRDAKQSGRPKRMTILVDPERDSCEVEVEAVQEQPVDDLAAALDEAKARGATRAAEILNGPDMLTADEFAAAIGASRETIHQKRKRHEVLGLEGAKRGVRFPEWQLSADGRLLPELPRLYRALGGHPWTVFRFLLQHHPALDGKTALDALREGRIDAVMATAENVGEGEFA
ncbi:hypothetical protein VSX64_24395 [Aurantimonas sp. C2-6-R+9]|uniref:hypothetical protein n=1 Tax=unclassified Aurantimonas TaxID=2638230 RepID=UPI002E194EBA|nr:hypothetical protein [Aurantimonas sp. C2-6-R+9]